MREGHAIVRLKNGTVYVGRAAYDGRAVAGLLALRVVVNGVVEHRRPIRRTVPLHVIREVVWDEDAVRARE